MPTDPAPRGADAPRQRELTALYARVQNVVEKHIEPVADQEEVLVAVTMYVRAIESLRSPVPAEATSGEEPSETDINAVLRSIGSQSEFFGRLGDGIVKVDITVGDSLIHHRKFTLAALRTPPAPLPREGATVTEAWECEAEEAIIAELAAEEWQHASAKAVRRGIRKAFSRLTAALTPAAQPTTKETR